MVTTVKDVAPVAMITRDGSRIIIDDALLGETIMQVATRHGVAGIAGECGGAMMCATCHIYDLSTAGTFSSPSDVEEEVLEGVTGERRANSRLSCQLVVGATASAIELQIPVE